MKFHKTIIFALVAVMTALMSSCGKLPELPDKNLGPTSSEDTKPWNRRLPGEGSAALGGLGR